MTNQTSDMRVLCVDLDGTVVATDLLWECFFAVMRTSPWLLLLAPVWLLRGRAHFKQRLALAADLDVSTLPYRRDVLEFMERERRRGRSMVLATAADHALAVGVSRHLGFFSDVVASDGVTNLKGRAKAASLVSRFGYRNFDYVGDSRADIPCWECSATAMTASWSRPARLPHLRSIRTADRRLLDRLRGVAAAARPHQWVKNLLLFVPAIAAHQLDGDAARNLAAAFVSFSLCASGTYILNDLLDLRADREHPRKRMRPFAAGQLSLKTGVALAVCAWASGFVLAAAFLPGAFAAMIAAYVAATTAYSVRLKREPVLDVMFLAGLYVMRVVAGAAATGTPVSSWLLAFMLFVFLSLAFLKRFVEVKGYAGEGAWIPGRGYRTDDAGWLHSAGIASAYLSVLVLAIYANGVDVTRLYGHPQHLVLLCPLLLFWSTRVWLQAHRGAMHDDPVIAVAADPVTYAMAAASAAIVWAAV